LLPNPQGIQSCQHTRIKLRVSNTAIADCFQSKHVWKSVKEWCAIPPPCRWGWLKGWFKTWDNKGLLSLSGLEKTSNMLHQGVSWPSGCDYVAGTTWALFSPRDACRTTDLWKSDSYMPPMKTGWLGLIRWKWEGKTLKHFWPLVYDSAHTWWSVQYKWGDATPFNVSSAVMWAPYLIRGSQDISTNYSLTAFKGLYICNWLQVTILLTQERVQEHFVCFTSAVKSKSLFCRSILDIMYYKYIYYIFRFLRTEMKNDIQDYLVLLLPLILESIFISLS